MGVYKGKCNKCGEDGKKFYGLNKICSDCHIKQSKKRGRIGRNDFMLVNGVECF